MSALTFQTMHATSIRFQCLHLLYRCPRLKRHPGSPRSMRKVGLLAWKIKNIYVIVYIYMHIHIYMYICYIYMYIFTYICVYMYTYINNEQKNKALLLRVCWPTRPSFVPWCLLHQSAGFLFESAPLFYLFLPPYSYDTPISTTNNCIIS